MVAGLVGGCQFLPDPPGRDHLPPGSPLLTLPSTSAAILVMPVANAPPALAQSLAAAMADALCVIDVPADTDSANRRSYRLEGTLSAASNADATATRQIRWQVVGADGAKVGAVTQIVRLLPQDWARPSAQLIAGLARSEAPAIAAVIQDPAPAEVARGLPAIYLYPVAGAPGDGERSLTLALGRALQQADIVVLDPNRPVAGGGAANSKRPGDQQASLKPTAPQAISAEERKIEAESALAIAGSVAVGHAQGPPSARQQHVKITWSVLAQSGEQLGSIDQENDIPAGSLDGAWGSVAAVVAQAAVDGIVPLLRHLALDEPS